MLKNKKHKYIAKITLGLAIVILPFFTSCEDSVVDLMPVANLSDMTAYETPERCDLAVVGAYDAAQQGRYGDSYSRGYPFGAASIIQGEMRGEDMNLTAEFFALTYRATYSTATANNRYMWETSFECINRVNTVLKGIDYALSIGVLEESRANQYKGELYFLRALTYHNLLIHFALPYNVTGNNNYGLPLYLTAINTPEEVAAALTIGRSTVEETYTQILTDLNQAETLLPETISSLGGASFPITRAGKGASIALKTRVFLHKRDWASVEAEAKKLTSGATQAPFKSEIGGYALEVDPATPFWSYQNNSESIFSIENNSADNASVNGAMASMMSARTGGRAICTASPTVYNSKYWKADDKRRKLLFYRESDKYYFNDKYQNPTTNEEYAPIIRYAEVLLNYSEAALRAGHKDIALNLLNAVRNRSLADPASQQYKAAEFSTTKAFVDAILWERRIEFQGEGRRWEDIHRLAVDDMSPSGGIPAKLEYNNMKGLGVFVVGAPIQDAWFGSALFIPYTDKRFIWPIPVNDIVRNPTLAGQQNAGW
ncbi:RagB/SusD family nutrient uptake outer membrane protein [Dysgonomonas sp. ZJ709]|uniref:RagB/SusD family nutrient uptake outer membrane protein n=1 Tax=Dysgonomonas sp. ZJ709 TaxID=2709797 RepID=UPI0013ED4583|nr:RagB/SusD family nutrient uptake outer membrane protein [Dysgonomonas sp. ZJ709]